MTTPLIPQDHLPKAEKIVRPQDTPGFSLLKSIDDVPVWDQAPLLSLVSALVGNANDGEEFELEEAQAIPLIGEIGRAMLPWALDSQAFTKFCSGKDALQRVADLAMAWTSSLGEDVSSGDS